MTRNTATATWGRVARTPRPRFGPAAVWNAMVAWQGRQSERIRLTEMDDHLLRDIGLTRAEVMREASSFWRN